MRLARIASTVLVCGISLCFLNYFGRTAHATSSHSNSFTLKQRVASSFYEDLVDFFFFKYGTKICSACYFTVKSDNRLDEIQRTENSRENDAVCNTAVASINIKKHSYANYTIRALF